MQILTGEDWNEVMYLGIQSQVRTVDTNIREVTRCDINRVQNTTLTSTYKINNWKVTLNGCIFYITIHYVTLIEHVVEFIRTFVLTNCNICVLLYKLEYTTFSYQTYNYNIESHSAKVAAKCHNSGGKNRQ